MNLASY